MVIAIGAKSKDSVTDHNFIIFRIIFYKVGYRPQEFIKVVCQSFLTNKSTEGHHWIKNLAKKSKVKRKRV